MQSRAESRSPWVGYPHRPGTRRTSPLRWQHQGSEVSTQAAIWHYCAENDDGPRPRLLLIHGFRGDHHGMQLLVDALPEFEVLVPDLPGFGQTPPVQDSHGTLVPHELQLYADFVTAVAEAEGFTDDDLLVGHSFGTLVVAAHLASPADRSPAARGARAGSTRAQRWAGAALTAPISDSVFSGTLLPGALGVELYYRVGQLLPETLGNRLIRSVPAMGITNLSMIISKDPMVRCYTKDQHARHFGRYANRQTLLEAYTASSRHTLQEFAQALELPVLLAAGSRDQLSTEAGRRALRDALPHAELEMIRGTGHLIHYEKPAQLGRALRRFAGTLA